MLESERPRRNDLIHTLSKQVCGQNVCQGETTLMQDPVLNLTNTS